MAKAIKSTDPRKPLLMAALKKASGCRKVTMVEEVSPGVYQGNCMNPNGPDSKLGFNRVTAEEAGL